MRIGIIGGGKVGSALGRLLQNAGHDVRLGVRESGLFELRDVSLGDAAEFGEVVILAVPYGALRETLPPLAAPLAGKIVVDATNAVAADWSPILLGEESSGGEETQRLIPNSRVVKAFNTIFADTMTPAALNRDGLTVTAFVASDDAAAADIVARLAGDAGFAPVTAGPLKVARYLEAMAHLNIQIAVGQGAGTDAAFIYHQNKLITRGDRP